MRPIDTLFIILAFGLYFQDPKQKYFVSILPILVFVLSVSNPYMSEQLQTFVLPVLSIVVCALCIRLAPMNLLLILTDYNNLWETILIPIIWIVVTVLMKSINARINDDQLPSYFRGFPLQMITLGIFYYILYPLTYL